MRFFDEIVEIFNVRRGENLLVAHFLFSNDSIQLCHLRLVSGQFIFHLVDLNVEVVTIIDEFALFHFKLDFQIFEESIMGS